MYFLKITVGLKKWHTGSDLTSPEFSYKSMRRRMAAVTEAQGGHTRYWAVHITVICSIRSVSEIFVCVYTHCQDSIGSPHWHFTISIPSASHIIPPWKKLASCCQFTGYRLIDWLINCLIDYFCGMHQASTNVLATTMRLSYWMPQAVMSCLILSCRVCMSNRLE